MYSKQKMRTRNAFYMNIVNLIAKKDDNNLARINIFAAAVKKRKTSVNFTKFKSSEKNLSNILKKAPTITKVDTSYLIKKHRHLESKSYSRASLN